MNKQQRCLLYRHCNLFYYGVELELILHSKFCYVYPTYSMKTYAIRSVQPERGIMAFNSKQLILNQILFSIYWLEVDGLTCLYRTYLELGLLRVYSKRKIQWQPLLQSVIAIEIVIEMMLPIIKEFSRKETFMTTLKIHWNYCHYFTRERRLQADILSNHLHVALQRMNIVLNYFQNAYPYEDWHPRWTTRNRIIS